MKTVTCETIVFEGPGPSGRVQNRGFFGDPPQETIFLDFEIILGGSGTPFWALLAKNVQKKRHRKLKKKRRGEQGSFIDGPAECAAPGETLRGV